MSAICPTHGAAKMRQGKRGPFCAAKMPDGSWCPWKPDPAPVAPVSYAPAIAAPVASQSPSDARWIASLAFAARIYQGCGEEGEAKAVLCAQTIFRLGPP